MKKVLLYGFGNIGRQDDGLGVLLIEHLEELVKNSDLECIDFEVNYQLNIEDAHTISQYDIVFFADACLNQANPIEVARVEPSEKTEFTMHAMNPSFILHLCNVLYNEAPETYLVTMRGSEFEFGQPITGEAQVSLDLAVDLMMKMLSDFTAGTFKIDHNSEIFTLNR